MPGKNLQQAAATLVQQVQARIQPLLTEVTSLEVSTYSVDAPQLESVAAAQDVATLTTVKRQGYTHIAFRCDLNVCTQTGREDTVDAAARPMHSDTVAQALAGRETLLAAGYEVLKGIRS